MVIEGCCQHFEGGDPSGEATSGWYVQVCPQYKRGEATGQSPATESEDDGRTTDCSAWRRVSSEWISLMKEGCKEEESSGAQ